jgi:hypothetical protein
MSDEVSGGDIGKSCVAMLECAEVEAINSADELLFQRCVNIVVLTPDVEGLFVVTEGGTDLSCGASSRKDWCCARVVGWDKEHC